MTDFTPKTRQARAASTTHALREGKDPHFSRRHFLVGSSAAGLLMAFSLADISDVAASGAQKALAARRFAPTIWWELDAEGIVHVNVIKAEMGHHIGTAFGRIVADELEMDWKDVRIIHVDSDSKWGFQETGGSTSVFQNFTRLSRAGAAGRVALIEAGAAMLGVPIAQCRAEASKVIAGDRSVTYAQIVRGGKLNRVFTPDELAKLPVKSPEARRLVGKSIHQLDIAAKLDGSAKFGIDATVPGMVYARPLPPPTRLGARVISVDDTEARKVPGYVGHVVIDDRAGLGLMPGWVTVAAETYWGAMKAAEVLKVEWQTGPQAKVDEAAIIAESDRLCANPAGGGLWVKEGDIDAALAGAAKTIASRYTTATAMHFQLEPVNALAAFQDGIWNIHMGTQWQTLIRPLVAKALDVPEDRVVLRQYYLGGGFGRRLWSDYAIHAALSAKALNRPVKLVFTRPDDAQLDCVRSPSVQTFKAAIDNDGNLLGIDHVAAAGWASDSIYPRVTREHVPGGGKLDPYSIMGADHWYTLPNHRVRALRNDLAHDTFVPGWLRGVGPAWVTWGTESFLDEIAHTIGKDPAHLRIALLDGAGKNAGEPGASAGGAKRLAVVLKRALQKAGWGQKLPPDTGLGVACSYGQEREMPTWTACVARVKVDRSTGVINVERLTHVLDCGTRIDPDGALAQAEGGTLWGVSLALHESSSFVQGRVSTLNLNSYTPLRLNNVPELDIEFIDNAEFPSGMGEPPVIAVAPAIGNAVFAAVGVRLRDLPMRPAQILRELKKMRR
jgi:CO/xanthine dehydrogenase Mo-binding subunit